MYVNPALVGAAAVIMIECAALIVYGIITNNNKSKKS